MKYTFSPIIRTLGQYECPIIPLEQLKEEPSYFRSSPDFITANSGILQKNFVNQLIEKCPSGYTPVFDSRLTMTAPSQYPSIPGWHCDAVPRGEHSQPQLSKIDPKVKHFMLLLSNVNSNTCTEFVSQKEITLDIDERNVWHSVDIGVKKLKPKTRFVKIGEIVQFDQQAIHRASPTQTFGWRLFMRLSFEKNPSIFNEIRSQVQIYTPMNKQGW